MKHIRVLSALAAAVLALSLTACVHTAAPAESASAPSDGTAAPEVSTSGTGQGTSFADALGRTVTLKSWDRVVSLYGSFAETWALAGGTLAGTTQDAVEERGMALGDGVAVVGTVKEPNLEEVLALEPDFVILSADSEAQCALDDALTEAGVPHAYYRVDTFADYLAMLEQFCGMTGRADLYRANGLDVQAEIERVLSLTAGEPAATCLLIRAYATGAKAKGEDNLAGVILHDLGAENLVSRHESLLEDVSMEEIIAADPDFIFVTTMGADTEKALARLAEDLQSNPAWGSLSAVKNNRCVVLPKELFHYKPNVRWGESYAYLAKILYPNLSGEIG